MTTTPTTPADVLSQFTWHRQPAAEQLVREIVAEFLNRCPEAADLAERMKTETGTRFHDWIDHVAARRATALESRLVAAGYEPTGPSRHHWVQPHGIFPPILLRDTGPFEIALKVESAADFAAVNIVANDIEGEPLSAYRWLPLVHRDDVAFSVVERHGYAGFTVVENDPASSIARLRHLEQFRARRRAFGHDDEAGVELAEGLIDAAISDLGQDLTCDLFFTAEREYWQRRNRAAQFQKARQDKLGLGWANHDHHTYRSSRKHFPRLIGLWEKLGFQLRERFYAGAEAGWGAQVAEHPNTGIVTFNDVDLSPDELMDDFSHNPLPERNHLGTVGLWCALHGESFLQAGMHHLECQFDFDSLRDQMQQAGIQTMNPFTDFPHLRQAFTEGERWPVDESRIARLLEKNQITPDQAEKFRREGALGSHLENLERNEGFKGFNQKGVSDIISKTDPRKQH